jgi:hypothetical protein
LEAISLIIAKFSHEIIQVQLAVVSLFGSVALYWFLIKRRKRQTSDWVPAAIVKEYLDRIHEDERQTRYRLFGIQAPALGAQPLTTGQPMMQMSAGAMDPNLLLQLEAMRAQLANADKRTAEFDKTINGIKEEKSLLEQKLKDLEGKPAANGGGPDPAMLKELEDYKARLKEYEVIEDDLANLKKYQIENKELKDKLAGMGGAPVAAPGPAPAPVAAAAPAPVAAAAAPEATPAASGQKKEAELLSEFEKMLAS